LRLLVIRKSITTLSAVSYPISLQRLAMRLALFLWTGASLLTLILQSRTKNTANTNMYAQRLIVKN